MGNSALRAAPMKRCRQCSCCLSVRLVVKRRRHNAILKTTVCVRNQGYVRYMFMCIVQGYVRYMFMCIVQGFVTLIKIKVKNGKILLCL